VLVYGVWLASAGGLAAMAGRVARRSAPRRPGESVLVWYEQADPTDVLVESSDGRCSDRAFRFVGSIFLLGVVLTGVGR
jgi:hypothetical protein